MCKTQFVLALAVLYLGLAHSWDIAVSLGNQLIFYKDGIKTNNVDLISHNVTALAYDEVHNMLLYVDKQSNKSSICGYNLFSMENKCFITRVDSNIESIAFDPATDTLFFTDTTERSINWISLKPGFNNNVRGNLLIKTDGYVTPIQIAVDSCRGYIYWLNRLHIYTDGIERARFNGSEREVFWDILPVPSMTTDPQTRKIYFHVGFDSYVYFKGMDNQVEGYISILNDAAQSTPNKLTVSNKYLHWLNSGVGYKTIWQMPKNKLINEELNWIDKFYSETPVAIVANYKIKDQIQGLQDCEALSNLMATTTVTDNSLNVRDTTETEQTTESTTLVDLSCVNGTEGSGMSVCKCIPGYIGGRCDVSICEIYCLQGDCSLNNEGVPKCRCKAGYSGERCEVYACHGFCLNNGDCSLNEDDQPVCQCVGNHEGTRCEAAINDAFTNTQTFNLVKRKPSLADLLSTWRKPSSKMFVTFEV